MINLKVVLGPLLVLIFIAALLILTPSIVGNVQAQMYGYQHENDHYKVYTDSKSSGVNLQNIKCVSSNVNVNGVDITQIPQDGTATTAEANKVGEDPDVGNTQNGDRIGDRINFDKNLVNICINSNQNEQVKITADEENEEQTCKDCFSILSYKQIQGIKAALSDQSEGKVTTIEEFCEQLSNNAITNEDKLSGFETILTLADISLDTQQTILKCLEGLGIIEIPPV